MITNYKVFELTLNESSFYDFSINNIFTDNFLKNFKNSEKDLIDIMYDWYIQKNQDDDDELKIRDNNEFNEYIQNILIEAFEDFQYNMYTLIKNNKIKIYREMTVDDNWINHLKKQGKRLGIYWSWDYKSAESHWGDYNKKNTVTIESEIYEKYIDWDKTIYMNIHPNYLEEREIRLFKNTPIIIKSITFNNEKIDISEIKNKVFLA
jgi:hypothetical protein